MRVRQRGTIGHSGIPTERPRRRGDRQFLDERVLPAVWVSLCRLCRCRRVFTGQLQQRQTGHQPGHTLQTVWFVLTANTRTAVQIFYWQCRMEDKKNEYSDYSHDKDLSLNILHNTNCLHRKLRLFFQEQVTATRVGGLS